MSELNVRKLSKRFKKRIILSDISLKLQTGEILGVFGRNGCGKTTLLKILFGTLASDEEDILINNECFHPSENIALRMISYLPQHDFLPKDLKVRNIIPMYQKLAEAQDKLFYDPRIAKIEQHKTGSLSMGERRYLEIALIAGLPHPFMLLDEPFSMIEPEYQEHIMELLNRLKKEKGILITDHYYRQVLEISDRKILIKDAQTIEIYSVNDLVNHGYLRETKLVCR